MSMRLRVLAAIVLLCLSLPALAQTTITDTMQLAGGSTPATGSVTISWPAFTTAGSVAVPAGSTTVNLSSGTFSVSLQPTVGSTPPTVYTAVFTITNAGGVAGATATQVEYWNVPSSGGPYGISAIQSAAAPNIFLAGNGGVNSSAQSLKDISGNYLVKGIGTSLAVNYFDVYNAATGNAANLASDGADAAVNIDITPKASLTTLKSFVQIQSQAENTYLDVNNTNTSIQGGSYIGAGNTAPSNTPLPLALGHWAIGSEQRGVAGGGDPSQPFLAYSYLDPDGTHTPTSLFEFQYNKDKQGGYPSLSTGSYHIVPIADLVQNTSGCNSTTAILGDLSGCGATSSGSFPSNTAGNSVAGNGTTTGTATQTYIDLGAAALNTGGLTPFYNISRLNCGNGSGGYYSIPGCEFDARGIGTETQAGRFDAEPSGMYVTTQGTTVKLGNQKIAMANGTQIAVLADDVTLDCDGTVIDFGNTPPNYGQILASTLSTGISGYNSKFTRTNLVGKRLYQENAATPGNVGTLIGTVSSVQSDGILTLAAAPAANYTGAYYLVDPTLDGTIAVSGTSVTGTGTAFSGAWALDAQLIAYNSDMTGAVVGNICNVNTGVSITLCSAYSGPTISGQRFNIIAPAAANLYSFTNDLIYWAGKRGKIKGCTFRGDLWDAGGNLNGHNLFHGLRADDLTIQDSHFEFGGIDGITVDTSDHLTIHNSYVKQNGLAGFALNASFPPTTITQVSVANGIATVYNSNAYAAGDKVGITTSSLACLTGTYKISTAGSTLITFPTTCGTMSLTAETGTVTIVPTRNDSIDGLFAYDNNLSSGASIGTYSVNFSSSGGSGQLMGTKINRVFLGNNKVCDVNGTTCTGDGSSHVCNYNAPDSQPFGLSSTGSCGTGGVQINTKLGDYEISNSWIRNTLAECLPMGGFRGYAHDNNLSLCHVDQFGVPIDTGSGCFAWYGGGAQIVNGVLLNGAAMIHHNQCGTAGYDSVIQNGQNATDDTVFQNLDFEANNSYDDPAVHLMTSSASITNGTNVLTAPTVNGVGIFSTGIKGAQISISGAGPAGATLTTTVASRTNSTTIVLAANASTTVTGTGIVTIWNVPSLTGMRITNNSGSVKVGNGTATTSGSTAVVGTGSNFAASNVGQAMILNNVALGLVTSFTDSTHISVALSTTATGQYEFLNPCVGTGTVTVSTGSTAVTGQGTTFNAATDVGQALIVNGVTAGVIASVTSTTSATLTANSLTNQTTQAYSWGRQCKWTINNLTVRNNDFTATTTPWTSSNATFLWQANWSVYGNEGFVGAPQSATIPFQSWGGFDSANGPMLKQLPNSSAGTATAQLAKINSSGAITAATTDTSGIIGICYQQCSGASTNANALIAYEGQAPCNFDGSPTATHWVQISSSVAGDCTDAGATRPTTGQILGHVISQVTGNQWIVDLEVEDNPSSASSGFSGGRVFSTSATVQTTDKGGELGGNCGSNCTLTLPDPTNTGFGSNFSFTVEGLASGIITVTPSSPGTATFGINATTTFQVGRGQRCFFASLDNVNWGVAACAPGLNGINSVVTDTGAANAYVISYPGITAQSIGAVAFFKAANANTGASTLNAGFGVVNITKNGASALVSGDIPASPRINVVMWDGTQWELLNPVYSGGVSVNGQNCVSGGASCNVNSGAATHSVAVNEGNGNTQAGAGPGTTNQLYASAGASADGGFKSLADLDGTLSGTGGGTANAQTVTLTPALTANANVPCVRWLPAAANTGATTLAVSGLTALNLTKNGTTALAANDLTTTAFALACGDGSRWQLLNPQTVPLGSTAHGVILSEGTGPAVSTGAGTQNQLFASGGSSADGGYKSWADLDSTQYAAATGTAQAQVVTLAPAATALVAGLEVNFLPVAANTAAAPTLALNGLTAKTITKFGTTALVANDLTTTAVASVIYDGTEWQLQNPQTNTGAGTPSFPQTIAGTVTTGGVFWANSTTQESSNANLLTNTNGALFQTNDAIGSGGSAQTISAANGAFQTITLSANLTISFTQPASGDTIIRLKLTQASSGGPYTVAWTSVKWPGGIAPVMSSGASQVDWYSCLLDGTNTYCTAGQNFQ